MREFFTNYAFEIKLTSGNAAVLAYINLAQAKEVIAIAVGIVAIICNVLVTRKKLKDLEKDKNK